MLDIHLQNLDGLTVTLPRSTHTAVIGTGASTLLKKIAGDVKPKSGAILFGARDVTKLSRGRRPLLYVTREIDAPSRWSVQHLLIAAVRQRTLDRIDRQHEFDHIVSKWNISHLLDRRLRTLSASEQTLAHVAHIELLKPGILIADGIIDRARIAADFYRMLRVLGTTVVSAPASLDELGFTDEVMVIEGNQLVQQGTFTQVYRQPASIAAATATGDVNLVPVTVRGREVESPIGSWTIDGTPFNGAGVAAVRPEHFAIAAKGEESDFIFGVEEATFHGDRWRATGFLTGNLTLTIELPPDTPLHKGRLIPLRYDPAKFTLYPS